MPNSKFQMQENVVYDYTGCRPCTKTEMKEMNIVEERVGYNFDFSKWKEGPKTAEFKCQCMDLVEIGCVPEHLLTTYSDEGGEKLECNYDSPMCNHLTAYSTIVYKDQNYIVNPYCAWEWKRQIHTQYRENTFADGVIYIDTKYDDRPRYCIYCTIWYNNIIKRRFKNIIEHRGQLDGFLEYPQATVSSEAIKERNPSGSYAIYMKGYLRGKSLREPMIKAART